MFTLVVGGAASGKSEYAEGLILAAGRLPRYYIATMEPFDAECRARIDRHRGMRAEKQFETVERYTDLSSLTLPGRGSALLECLGNLAANELYGPTRTVTEREALEAVVGGVEAVLSQCDDLVVVSNEVFTDGVDYGADTEVYRRVLAGANRALAARADRVCEVVCGLPRYCKGEGPAK